MTAIPVQLITLNTDLKLAVGAGAVCLCQTGILAVMQHSLREQRQSSSDEQRLCPRLQI